MRWRDSSRPSGVGLATLFGNLVPAPRANELVLGVISRTGTIFIADDDGTDYVTLLGPDKIEICHLHATIETRNAACAELTRQP